MRIRVMYKSKFSMGGMTRRRFLMIPCEILLRSHLSYTSIIYLLGSGRGRVDDLGYSL